MQENYCCLYYVKDLELCFIYTLVLPCVFVYDNLRNSPHSQFTVIFHFIIPLMLMFLATVRLWDLLFIVHPTHMD